jgi:hypothetical protein
VSFTCGLGVSVSVLRGLQGAGAMLIIAFFAAIPTLILSSITAKKLAYKSWIGLAAIIGSTVTCECSLRSGNGTTTV